MQKYSHLDVLCMRSCQLSNSIFRGETAACTPGALSLVTNNRDLRMTAGYTKFMIERTFCLTVFVPLNISAAKCDLNF